MKRTNGHFSALIGSTLCVFVSMTQNVIAQDAQIKVDASRVINQISPLIYGSGMEDVNHEVYGGLYDQKIFGEGFEEPPVGMLFKNFTRYEGFWGLDGKCLTVSSFSGAKLVAVNPTFENGSVEAELKFTGVLGDNAGLLFHVSNAGNGGDNFEGYEISLQQNGKKVILGKHRFNWTALAEADLRFNRYDWTHLRVKMTGPRIQVFVNRAEMPIIDYTDNNNPLLSGKVGVRTWNADAAFRNLQVENSEGTIKIPFEGTDSPSVSALWDIIDSKDIQSEFSLDEQNTWSGKNAQSIEFISGTGKLGVANRSLNRWGIAVEKGQKFQGRLHLRAMNLEGPVTIALQSSDGTRTYASRTIEDIAENWEEYSFTLTSEATDPNARFAIWIENKGKIWIDQVVLLQTGNKLFKGMPYRADIGNAMIKEGLTFLRYGGTMINAPEYRFKKMIGNTDKRPPYIGHYYKYSSNGFGIEDFLKFSEAAGFVPSFAINVEETAHDAADMVEYLNGAATTTWGKKRAENGHTKPYRVKYIEIGNEEVIFNGDDKDEYLHYVERFEDLEKAIHAKDPSVELVIAAWWRMGSPNMKLVFDRLNKKAAYWDFHPGADDADAGLRTDKELTEIENLFKQWNPDTKLKITIFEENGGLHNMQRALGHATTLNAVRRHSESLLTSCPANALQPYKQNDNGWDQGQVFFTSNQVWGMPPFYVQQMASMNQLPLRVADETTGGLDVTATCSVDKKTLVLHVVNVKDTGKATSLSLAGLAGKDSTVKTWTLAGALNAENTPEEPEKIVPIVNTLKVSGDRFNYSFPAYSYTILRIER